MKAREGDFIRTAEQLIFDVKGLVHPPRRVVSYLRYIPDGRGSRTLGKVRYRKVYPLTERMSVLERRWSTYIYFDNVFGRKLQGVPTSRIAYHYRPQRKVVELRGKAKPDDVELNALQLVDELRDAAALPSRFFGISGSVLVGLHTLSSDVDLIVYGLKASEDVYETLKGLTHAGGGFKQYGRKDFWRLYRFRALEKALDFNSFLKHERRKVFVGRFRGRSYFVRCIKDWGEVDEVYGERKFQPMGSMSVKAVVADDSEGIFTPCSYLIEKVKVVEGSRKISPKEVVSFRGRFCEHAFSGEKIFVRGQLEGVLCRGRETYRLVIGEHPTDCMVCDQFTHSLPRHFD